jgi:hypothetical protein
MFHTLRANGKQSLRAAHHFFVKVKISAQAAGDFASPKAFFADGQW